MSVEAWKQELASELQEARRWKESQWQDVNEEGGFPLFIDCAHSGCRMVKPIYAVSPRTLKYAEKTAASEVWYCHHHDTATWQEQRHIKQELLPYLKKLQTLGTINKSKLRLKKRDLAFLKDAGLITVDVIPKGTSKTVYDIELSEQGEQYLTDHTDELAQYLQNLPRSSELEWYAYPIYSGATRD